MSRLRLLAAGLCAAILTAASLTQAHNVREEVMAPGWGELSYVPPSPGTYVLPPIKPAPDGTLVQPDSSSVRLHELMGDRFVILSFIYTQCNDANGCPLANAVLYAVQNRIGEIPEIRDAVRLISVSFDPEHDDPHVMGELREFFQRGESSWDFLAATSQNQLQPILDGYGQWIMREFDEHGEYTHNIAHMLRVYLIDREKRIRNIYSVSFLHPDILMNDLETLLLESPGS